MYLAKSLLSQDTWTDSTGVVQQEAQQDCGYVDHDRVHGVTRLVFSRQFDTCDQYDYVIEVIRRVN